jgi:hypothetical protein
MTIELNQQINSPAADLNEGKRMKDIRGLREKSLTDRLEQWY